jgi:excisionase family DNA binding protein
MNPSEQRPQMLTPAQVAARCGLSTKTVLRAIRRGDLRASQLGNRRAFRVRVEDLDAWIVANDRAAADVELVRAADRRQRRR